MRTLSSLAFAALTLAACSPKTQVVKGSCAKVNGADVCTWGEMKGNAVTAFGATVPMAAITGAPAEMKMVWPPVADASIAMPAEVASGTGFKTLTIFWEPHGHPPKIMAVPHWDFHFYDMAGADVAAIGCADTVKAKTLPAGYALPDIDVGPPIGMLTGLCVAGMGMHALLASELTDTTLWTGSMVIGYDHQKPVFVEPMMPNSTMLAKKPFTLALPAVPGSAATSHYPTQFHADFDSTSQSYKFVFSGFSGGAP
jgi:hypothetical protein